MPALQVRDFPEDLYEKLRAAAARNHRSIAQQTIAWVEEGLYGIPSRDSHVGTTFIDFSEEEAKRAKRIESRKYALNKLKQLFPADNTLAPTHIVDAVAASREQRSNAILLNAGLPSSQPLASEVMQ